MAPPCLPTPGLASREARPHKKSHAKKRPPGHIPRPRNAFIIFRCDFVEQKNIPTDVETDHRNISRIAGKIWRAMSDESKKPWVDMAQQEREEHAKRHPHYRYTPGSNSISKRNTLPVKGIEDASDAGSIATTSHSQHTRRGAIPTHNSPVMPTSDAVVLPRRSSSCPLPSSTPVLNLPPESASVLTFSYPTHLGCVDPALLTAPQLSRSLDTPGAIASPMGSAWSDTEQPYPWLHEYGDINWAEDRSSDPASQFSWSSVGFDRPDIKFPGDVFVFDTRFRDPFAPGSSPLLPSTQPCDTVSPLDNDAPPKFYAVETEAHQCPSDLVFFHSNREALDGNFRRLSLDDQNIGVVAKSGALISNHQPFHAS